MVFLAVKQPAIREAAEQALSQRPATAVFSFSAQDTPNIRDKVIWVPQTHTWKLLLTRAPKNTDPLCDDTGKALSVDGNLKSAPYKAAKQEAYERAKRAWNLLDGSKRHRIADAVAPTTADEIPSEVGGMLDRWHDDQLM